MMGREIPPDELIPTKREMAGLLEEAKKGQTMSLRRWWRGAIYWAAIEAKRSGGLGLSRLEAANLARQAPAAFPVSLVVRSGGKEVRFDG